MEGMVMQVGKANDSLSLRGIIENQKVRSLSPLLIATALTLLQLLVNQILNHLNIFFAELSKTNAFNDPIHSARYNKLQHDFQRYLKTKPLAQQCFPSLSDISI